MNRNGFRGTSSSFAVALVLTLGGCSCSSTSSTTDAGSDAGTTMDAGVDAGPTATARFLQRNAAGSVTSSSQNYRMIRTHGRGTAGESANYTQRDAVHGGGRP